MKNKVPFTSDPRLVDALRKGSGRVHMVGIGGFGMAGLASHLADHGFQVDGCDLEDNRLTTWLRDKGIPVERGHDQKHLHTQPDWVVRSAAVPETQPELRAAVDAGIPVWKRGEVLAAAVDGYRTVAVSGTHGKTTTSAMITHLLQTAGRSPWHCIGGEVPGLEGVAGKGDSDLLVVEADESDGTVALYHPEVAVITNIEFDHMEHFESERDFIRCFETFAANAKQRVVCCYDDPNIQQLLPSIPHAVTYGLGLEAKVRAVDVEPFAREVHFTLEHSNQALGRIRLPLPGIHNVLNALAACAVALEEGVSPDEITSGLESFAAPLRRFEVVLDRPDLVVISDYAHHPTEIAAALASARGLGRRRVLAVFQPHRYTRTKALLHDFPPALAGVDGLVLAPVYAASEAPLEGGTSGDLLAACKAQGLADVELAHDLDDAWSCLSKKIEGGDVLMIIGAGDVEQLVEKALELPVGDEVHASMLGGAK